MRVIPLAILSIIFCIRSPAPLIPGPNLAKRIESAQIIVVAKLVNGTTLASGDRVSSDFALHVDRVLKGELTPGSEIGAHLEGRGYFMMPAATQSAITGQIRGIWFLNPGAHAYTVISRDGSYGELFVAPVVLPDDAPPGKPGATPALSVLNELVAALRWVAETREDRLSPQAERTGTAEDRKLAGLAISRFRTLAEDIRTLDDSITSPAYRELAGDKSVSLRAIGVQGMIAANVPEGVKYAAEHWDELSASVDVSPIVHSLMGFSNGSDGTAVRALGTLAMREPAQPMLRENASYALRAIHTKEAIPTLVGLLGVREERVRINALSGLCLFVRNAPIVTPQAVISMSWMQSRQPAPLLNEQTQNYCFMGGTPGQTGDLQGDLQRYADFWTSWWSQHRIEIEQN